MDHHSWKDYLAFSKKERVAVVILLIIIFCAVILPFLINNNEEKPIINKQLEQQVAQLKSNNDSIDTTNEKDEIASSSYQATTSDITETKPATLFNFDPNTLNEEGWRKLGLNEKTIQTILHYRNKGGWFKQPADIRKIYGLKKEKADKLIPYIKIQDVAIDNKKTNENLSLNAETSEKRSTKKIEPIDINIATVEQWKALPMIGDVLSNRIVKFRNKLGGFTSIDQVKQTYGLSDSTFEIIKPYLSIKINSTKINNEK